MSHAAMPPARMPSESDRQRKNVNKTIDINWKIPRRVVFSGIRVDTSDLAMDQVRFNSQNEFLNQINTAAILLTLVDGESGDHVEVPLDFHIDGAISRDTIARVIEDVAHWSLPVRPVGADEAKKIFMNRIYDVIRFRARVNAGDNGLHPPNDYPVSITSNRAGDEILYANGHFYSTRSHLGYSSCSGLLPANRYSFGIHDASGARFHTVLVSVPLQNSPFHVPLP